MSNTRWTHIPCEIPSEIPRHFMLQNPGSVSSGSRGPLLTTLVFFLRLVGDVLLATGFLSYSGPFNQAFRTLLLDNWKKEMRKMKIPFSEVMVYEKISNG